MPVDGPDHVSSEDSPAFDERKILAVTLSANLVHDRRTGRERVVQVGPYYLQWAPHERGLQVELVSDRFLAEADRLTPFGETRMRALGFYPPSDDSPNWTLHLEDEWRALELAETLATALLEVYRVPLRDLAAAVGPLPPFDDMTEQSQHLDPGTSPDHPLTIRKRVTATEEGSEQLEDGDTGFDSRHWARTALDMLECAQRLEWFASGPHGVNAIARDPVESGTLRDAAEVLRSHVPIHGLVSLGIADFGLCDEDLMWLLREHLSGRNPGIPHGGPDLRRPLRHLRQSLEPDDDA